MFKKVLASIGIGAAKVDTVLHTEHLLPGQKFSAEVIITAGDVEQDISGLELALMTKVKAESDEGEYFADHVLDKWSIVDQRTLQPGEELRIPFEARLHSETPITEISQGINQSVVWIATGLNIDFALDATDRDPVYVYPNEAVKTFMLAMEKLGYKLVKSDVEKGYLRTSNFNSTSGCYQELEYKPAGLKVFGPKEVELSFVPEALKTHVLIEVDRMFGSDGYADLTIEHDQVNLSQICDQLEHIFS
ncbi:sporulation protein [Pseudoalteromonas sp. XMcav1-K]|uniref:sporulation protein n=1 Tax=Pseudoalteromonas sp. XMcav1-K TaxID=3374372 RepID=UPI003756AEF6